MKAGSFSFNPLNSRDYGEKRYQYWLGEGFLVQVNERGVIICGQSISRKILVADIL